MSGPRPLIMASDGAWVVAIASGGAVKAASAPWASEPADAAAALREALIELGGRGPVCLALASNDVLAASVDAGDLPRRRRRTALLYRLEGELPVDAEDLTADFLPARGSRRLGVAARTDKVAGRLDALSTVGIEVDAIRPAAPAALWQLLQSRRPIGNYVVLADGDALDVFHMNGDAPDGWLRLADEPDALTRRIGIDRLSGGDDRPPSIAWAGARCPTAIEAAPDGTFADVLCADERSPLELAAMAVADRRKRAAGWADLRQGELGAAGTRRRLGGAAKWAACLALAALACGTAALYVRGERYDRAARAYADHQRRLYAAAFPNERIPVAVRRRLESDALRLAGLRGRAGRTPQSPDALETLRRTIAALPEAMRIRLLEIRVDPQHVTLDGQVRSHGDAEAIQQALDDAGLPAGRPGTEALADRGVSFTLTASADAEPQGGAP